jgi:hypothetical protein
MNVSERLARIGRKIIIIIIIIKKKINPSIEIAAISSAEFPGNNIKDCLFIAARAIFQQMRKSDGHCYLVGMVSMLRLVALHDNQISMYNLLIFLNMVIDKYNLPFYKKIIINRYDKLSIWVEG